MKKKFDLEWKVSGLLPQEIGSDCKYFIKGFDTDYGKRVFGRHDLNINTFRMTPTKLFHQALKKEIKRVHGIALAGNSFPYSIPFRGLSPLNVSLGFRVFGENFLVITVRISKVELEISTKELIELQKISENPVIISILRCCFNLHFSPFASEMQVKGWQWKPILKLVNDSQYTELDLVKIVTRHDSVNMRAVNEMLLKNEALNFNEDIMLLDKQGAIFSCTTTDRENQKNRLKRILALYEYATYVKSLEIAINEGGDRYYPCLVTVNKALSMDLLSQSVSAKRAWELIVLELSIKPFNVTSKEGLATLKKENTAAFSLETIIIVAAALATIAGFIFGLESCESPENQKLWCDLYNSLQDLWNTYIGN